jgi:hypothetical protein
MLAGKSFMRCARGLRKVIWCLPLLTQIAFAAPAVQHQPVLAPGASIDAGQWRVKPVRARISAEHPLGRAAPQGQSFLLVEVELTNLMEKSSRDFTSVLHIEPPAPAQLGEPAFVLVRDLDLPDRLHPNMPEVLLLVWPWPSAEPAPTELRLTIQGKKFKKADNLTGAPGWFNPKVVAVAALPVSAR